MFLHVPKTAGTALANVLRLNAPREAILSLGNVFKGGGGISTGLIDLLRDNSKPLGLDKALFVTGHFPLGVGELLRLHVGAERELRFFTFLREPTDRTLSHYYQVGSKPQSGEKLTGAPLPENPTIEDMLERGFIHDNVHTRMLSGDVEPFGEVTPDMLDRAKRNLRESFVFVGLSERFDESIMLAKQRLGLGTVFPGPVGKRRPRSLVRSTGRVNTARPRGDEVPKEMQEAARRCNEYDLELYDYAVELFESYPEHQDVGWQADVATLRAARHDGDIEVELPPPAPFSGSDEEWRLLVTAKATLLRQEIYFRDLTRLNQLRKGCEDALDLLTRIKEKQAILAERTEAKLGGSKAPKRRTRERKKRAAAQAKPGAK